LGGSVPAVTNESTGVSAYWYSTECECEWTGAGLLAHCSWRGAISYDHRPSGSRFLSISSL